MKGFTNRFTKRANKVTEQSLPAPEPRTMEEITKDYSDLLGKAAQAGYQKYVYEKQLAQLNERLEQLNYEGARRQKFDAEAAAAAPKTEGTNEQA